MTLEVDGPLFDSDGNFLYSGLGGIEFGPVADDQVTARAWDPDGTSIGSIPATGSDGTASFDVTADAAGTVLADDAGGRTTTQPTTRTGVLATTRPNSTILQVGYYGPGRVRFYQTVSISGSPVTDAMRAAEKSDHGGQDPFNGPVPDNTSGDPNTPYSLVRKIPGGWLMTDNPSFPASQGYPSDFVGTKSFVTTVVNDAGNTIATVTWHTSRAADGTVTTTIDSQ
jgi:hypothetical protein